MFPVEERWSIRKFRSWKNNNFEWHFNNWRHWINDNWITSSNSISNCRDRKFVETFSFYCQTYKHEFNFSRFKRSFEAKASSTFKMWRCFWINQVWNVEYWNLKLTQIFFLHLDSFTLASEENLPSEAVQFCNFTVEKSISSICQLNLMFNDFRFAEKEGSCKEGLAISSYVFCGNLTGKSFDIEFQGKSLEMSFFGEDLSRILLAFSIKKFRIYQFFLFRWILQCHCSTSPMFWWDQKLTHCCCSTWFRFLF